MSFPFLRFLPVVSLVAVAACGSSVSPQADGDEATSDLVNAPRDAKHPWAVGVCASEPNTDPAKGNLGACLEPETRCTGSLVAPNVVLTARHCTNQIDWSNAKGFCDAKFTPEPLTGAGMRVTLNESVLNENPTWLNVREVITSPTSNACDDDVALLVLDAPIAASDAKPIAMSFVNYAKKWWLRPAQVAVVGRGVMTSLIDPEKLAPIDVTEDLTRRYLEHIPFRCISDQPGPGSCETVDITSPPSNKFTLPPSMFLLGPGLASGDSGAAIVTQASFTADAPVAIGVNSAGTYGKNGVANAALIVRLDRHEAWIEAALAKAAAE